MPTRVGTVTTLEQTSGASLSGSVTIDGGSTFYLVVGAMYDGSGDTVSATLGGVAADATIQGAPDGFTRAFAFGWNAPTSGSQTLAISGGDAGDLWIAFGSNWTDVPDSAPFWDADAFSQSDSATVATDADSVAIGLIYCATNPTPGQTEIAEYQETNFGEYLNVQQAAGTGGNVTISWTAFDTVYVALRLNLLHETDSGGGPTGSSSLTLLGVG